MHLSKKNFSLLFLLVPFLANAQKPVASKTPIANPGQTTVYDTTYKGWEILNMGEVQQGSLIADKKGNMYCIKNREISKFQNNTWVSIQHSFPGIDSTAIQNVMSMNCTILENDNLAVEIYNARISSYQYFTYLQSGWQVLSKEEFEAGEKKVTLDLTKYPPLPSNINSISIKQNTNQHGHRYVTAWDNQYNRKVLFEYSNSEWKQLFRFPPPSNTNFFSEKESVIFLNNKIYMTGYTTSVFRQNEFYFSVYDLEKFTVTARTASPLTGSAAMHADKTITIFEVNGKKGLKNINGETVLYPLFDSITLEYTKSGMPSNDNCTVGYHLVNNQINCYIQACHTLRNPDYLSGFTTSFKTCGTCNGKGRYKNDTTSIPVRVWVPEKTISTGTSYTWDRVWNTSTNTYDNIRKTVSGSRTEGGYYKDAGYKEKITPGAACWQCVNGIESITYQYLEYNKTDQRYILKNSTAPTVKKPFKVPKRF